jgi:hypothetical protein
MSLQQSRESGTAGPQDVLRPRHRPRRPRQLLGSEQILSGTQFRKLLGWGTDKFAALVQSGRVDHLRSVNLSTARRVVYVRDKVLAWIQETPTLTLRARQQRSR